MKRQITFFGALLFFFLLQPEEVISFTFLGDHLCRHDDAVALLQFKGMFSISTYASPNCDDWRPKTTHWKADTDCCNWDGVTCHNLTGRVIGLDLSCSLLQGVIHPNSTLFHLSHLCHLNLAFNNFTGSQISHQFGSLKSLIHLNLSQSYFEGKVALEISHLPNLNSLDLSLNKLLLGYNLLSGNISNSLLNFTHLSFLDLSKNQMTGKIRDFKSRLLLRIRLENNQLSGSIPPSIFTIPTLSSLDLSSNYFTGIGQDLFVDFNQFQKSPLLNEAPWNATNNVNISYPDYLSYLNLSHNFLTGSINQLPMTPSLEYLDVSSNSLHGPIPSSICNASLLKILDLSTNNLSGPIPQCLGNFSQHLDIMDLGNNRLSGTNTIPTTFSKGNSLRFLKLNDNQLHGPVSRSLVHCEDLELLDLGNNEIDDKFPVWLEFLSNLEVLILRSNRFHGAIGNCQTKSPFPQLRIIDASHNELTGALPKDILSNFKAMKSSKPRLKEARYMRRLAIRVYYYIHSVELFIKGAEYSLERIIGSRHSLQLLTLSHNNFSGPIPKAFGNLSMLESLDLSWNQLEGTIPRELLNLDFLGFLNLSENRLVGPIPLGRHFDTFGDDSYRGNLDFHAYSLSRSLANVKKLEILLVGDHNISDIFPTWLENLPRSKFLSSKADGFLEPLAPSRIK
ncbi:unnamed protein product [Coffea canephora]|uniref:Leucine-rich repeat-containing N-terminal plant-type domain-containing protein n=1 Tax=Coffea canephora TaxID=49390 RepID=A0A068V4X2_COFCA|nr:unnamed protein product [Coffea canephora]